MAMKICPNCRTQNGENEKFCGQCGSPLANVCPGCGKTVGANEAFCGNCGTRFTQPPVSINPGPTPPIGTPGIKTGMNISIPGLSGVSISSLFSGIMAILLLIFTFGGNWFRFHLEIFYEEIDEKLKVTGLVKLAGDFKDVMEDLGEDSIIFILLIVGLIIIFMNLAAAGLLGFSAYNGIVKNKQNNLLNILGFGLPVLSAFVGFIFIAITNSVIKKSLEEEFGSLFSGVKLFSTCSTPWIQFILCIIGVLICLMISGKLSTNVPGIKTENKF